MPQVRQANTWFGKEVAIIRIPKQKRPIYIRYQSLFLDSRFNKQQFPLYNHKSAFVFPHARIILIRFKRLTRLRFSAPCTQHQGCSRKQKLTCNRRHSFQLHGMQQENQEYKTLAIQFAFQTFSTENRIYSTTMNAYHTLQTREYSPINQRQT